MMNASVMPKIDGSPIDLSAFSGKRLEIQGKRDKAQAEISSAKDFGLSPVEGILLFDSMVNLIHVNETACSVLKRISQKEVSQNNLPQEVLTICQWMNESRRRFKQQSWLMNFRIAIPPLEWFQIQARWIRNETASEDLLMLTMEDQNQYAKDIFLEESRHYGLTAREQEVWLLHRQNRTYKEIANKLNITSNTVKKHMKNILTKQRKAKG